MFNQIPLNFKQIGKKFLISIIKFCQCVTKPLKNPYPLLKPTNSVYSTVLYCTALCCSVVFSTALSCTVLYLLYCTVLYCTRTGTEGEPSRVVNVSSEGHKFTLGTGLDVDNPDFGYARSNNKFSYYKLLVLGARDKFRNNATKFWLVALL